MKKQEYVILASLINKNIPRSKCPGQRDSSNITLVFAMNSQITSVTLGCNKLTPEIYITK